MTPSKSPEARAVYDDPVRRRAEIEARMRHQQERLIEAGLLDPDQPTPWSHYQHVQRTQAEFSPGERALIRYHLGLTP